MSSSLTAAVAFAACPIDRAGNLRRDAAWVAAQRKHADAAMLVLAGTEVLLDNAGHPVWLSPQFLETLPTRPEPLLLGLESGAPRFAIDVEEAREALAPFGTFTILREASQTLSPDELSIIGMAYWLLRWHRNHQFCAKDGGETTLAEGGFKRVNPATGAEHFPRTDPVAIVLPIHGDAVCLARGVNFPPGLVSAPAGYLEACESLEACAARELHEELGLTVTATRYIASQPWPFSSSLMVGFHADVAERTLTIDPTEIDSAAWYERQTVIDMLNGEGPEGIIPPHPIAIARQLLEAWVER